MARRCSICHREGHDKRRHGARRNPPASSAHKSEAQLGAAIERAEARVAAALAGWRGSKSKAENDEWKRKTRQADLALEKAKNALSMRRFHEHYQAQRRVPAGPLAQLRLFNPKPVFIRFAVDKNGRRRAWKSYGGSQYLREFPIGVEEAELLLSTGQAKRTEGGTPRRVNPANPDFYRDRFGRPHPVRGTPGYEDAFVGMSRADKRYLRSGSEQPRGGYTQEAGGRALRVTAEKRRSTAKRDVNAGERLARGRTAAQKQAAANRRYRVMGR